MSTGMNLALGIVIGAVLMLIIRPFLEGASKGVGERFSEWGMGRIAEGEKARGKQPVEQENAEHKAGLEIANMLRTAAIERRLQAHQEAFALWRDLLGVYHDPKGVSVVIKAQTWWNNNCLYLEPDARQALVDAWSIVSLYSADGRSGELDPHAAAQIKQDFKDFHSAGDRILKAVALPPLAEREVSPKPRG